MTVVTRTLRRIAALTLTLAAIVAGSVACSSIDDTRIPRVPVNIVFQTIGVWDRYGVGGAMEYRYFVKGSANQATEPSDFPYTAASATGFGGVLLACDYYGNTVAYDMCCPVECNPQYKVRVDYETNMAVCPKCHSTYSVFENYGRPTGGTAAERGYGLTVYRVATTATGQRVITN